MSAANYFIQSSYGKPYKQYKNWAADDALAY